MTWNQVLTLLHVAQMSNDFPQLHPLRNAAVMALQHADPAALHFESDVQAEPALEEEDE